MSERPPQRNLILILARDFASRLATAVVLVDEQGSIIYYNEAASRMLGIRFIEGAGMPADDWSTRFHQVDEAGQPIGLDENPLGIAFRQQKPNHRVLRFRDLEGDTHRVGVTAFPLLAHAGDLVGALAIFWEQDA